ncbi:hypothetical protein JTB14_025542 [Gonioctena quinquepunctata]|nr:hypothetical protein JTB14_025542 [Gonioctena quinquepunctata]
MNTPEQPYPPGCACQICRSPPPPTRAPEPGYNSSRPTTVGTPVPNSRRITPAEEGCRCIFCTRQRSANPGAQDDQASTPREEWYSRSISPENDAKDDEFTDQEDSKTAVGPRNKVPVLEI